MNKRHSKLVLLAIAAVTACCLYLISQLKVNYDFEAYFPQNSQETDFFVDYRSVFETDNDFFFVALENKEGIFHTDFLRKADSLANQLKAVPNMVEVQVLTQLKEYTRDPFIGTLFRTPVLAIDDSLSFPADSARIFAHPEWVGVFVSADAKSLAINMKHVQHLSKAKSDELAMRVQEIVNGYSFDNVHIIGRALGQKMYVETMISELILFISISLLLTIVFLFVAFRSGWGVVIPTLVVLMAIIWTLGFVKLIGKDIDLMMTILPTIIFVVGMSDSVHVLTKYMQELRNGREKMDAIRYAFKSIRLATFLTALTTSIGFMTLVFSNIKPISDFGVYTSVGVMLAYGLTYTMLPAILILGKPKRMVAFALSDDFWTRKLERFFLFVLRRRVGIMIGGIAVLALSFWGISRVTVDNKMLEDLRDDHLLKREFAFMENQFSGCRPFEMALKLKPGYTIYDAEVLREAEVIQQYLKDEYKVGSLFSLVNILKEANKTWHGGQQEYFRIPTEEELAELSPLLERKNFKPMLNLVASDSVGWLRIAGKVADVGRQHYDGLNEQVNRYIEEQKFKTFDCQITGTAHLIDLNNKLLVDNLVLDLLLSVLCIGIVMGVVYKSFKMIVLTIIPNLIPLLIVAGIMGFTGIPIKVSTSIIFNIAFGIAVDDTVHFLARVRTLLGEGLSVRYAVKRTFLTTGKAMIVTTLILSGGFLTLMFSDFLGTFYIGLLISLTLFIAILAELLFSPLIVMYFYKKIPASFTSKARG
jgi:uncharacterized protein